MDSGVFLTSALQQFKDYKSMGDRTFAQVEGDRFHSKPNEASNSLAAIITHMHGNMLSRWTNFLTEDGEKEWRQRDAEFAEQLLSKQQLLQLWEEGWSTLFNALEQLKPEDLERTVYIRTKPLTVLEAVHRQLTHYASHVGQVIYLGKIIAGDDWQTLSIAKGASREFNEKMKQ